MGVLQGQVAIVTGAAQGIGRAVAVRLRAEGCEVAITDRQRDVHQAAAEIGASGHDGDVADPTHVRAVVDDVLGRHGRIDVLVNNAGVALRSDALDGLDGAAEQFDTVVGTNTKGPFLFGRAVAPVMVEGGGGHIVNVSTDHVKPCPDCHPHHGHGQMDLYNASKWALNGFTFDWARTLAPHGVRVNNLCVGATDTAMLRNYRRGELAPEVVATWLQPDQVAAIVVELLGEGPGGRTADNVGIYAGYPVVLPPPGA